MRLVALLLMYVSACRMARYRPAFTCPFRLFMCASWSSYYCCLAWGFFLQTSSPRLQVRLRR
jgi:hypothetical protein